MADFEPRRLIKFGNSSFIVSLPKEWVLRNNLKKGDWVYVGEDDGALKIKSGDRKEKAKEEKKVINIEKRNFDEVNRIIISAYINNCSEIILRGKNDLIRKELGRLTDKTGLEIVEQTDNEVIIKDFLSIEGVSIEKLIRRMDNMIRSLFEDLLGGLEEKVFRDWRCKEMYKVDKEINKLYFMTWKIIKKGQRTPSLFLEKLSLTQEDLSNVQWIIIHLESIADELKRVAKFLVNSELGKEKAEFIALIASIEKNYTDLMTAYYQKEEEKILEIITKKDEVVKLCDRFAEKSSFSKIGAVCERIKVMASSIHHISKIIVY